MKEYDSPTELAGLEGTTRPFTLRGITFHAKPVMDVRSFGTILAIETGEITGDVFVVLNKAIRDNLVESSRAEWDALFMQDLAVPITFKTLFQIAEDLASEATGRPPAQPVLSGLSNGSSGTPSTAVSSSPLAAPSPTSP